MAPERARAAAASSVLQGCCARSKTTLILLSLLRRFAGDAAGEDMQCPNMLDGKSWKEDADWFGLCATSHVLLFGAHLEVSKDVRGRWRCNKSIRRYWQGDLWNKFFDELLNEGGAEGAAIDFDGLLEGFRDFVGGRSKELKALLRHQMLLVKDSTLKKK